MKLKALFAYTNESNLNKSPVKKRREGIPINSFSVLGGAMRTINMKSTTDFLIASEFEQARQYKNITLFMSPADGALDMLVAVELTAFASTREPLIFNFYVDRYANDSQWEILGLYSEEATVTAIPQIVANHELMISFSVPNLKINHGRAGQREAEF